MAVMACTAETNLLKRPFGTSLPESASKRMRRGSDSSLPAESDIFSLDDCSDRVKSGTTTPYTPATPSSPTRKSGQRSKTYTCNFAGCGKAFTRPVRLEEHQRSHTGVRPFQCPETGCGKDFQRQTHLNRHIKSAHTSERDYLCDVAGCEKKFTTGTRLRRHKESVHEQVNTFKCTDFPPCEQTFRKHATLQRHVDADHLGLAPFQCKIADQTSGRQCDERFDTAAKLHSHERQMHRETATSFTCIICNTKGQADDRCSNFATHGDLQRHVKVVHPPVCTHCRYTARSMGDLQKHVDMHHAEQAVGDRKIFPCEWIGCKKYFTRKSNLMSHVKTAHEKQKAFKCGETDLSGSKGLETWHGSDACGQTFAHKATLEGHVRKVHAGTQQARCQLPTASTSRPSKKAPEASSHNGMLVCPDDECGAMLDVATEYETHLRMDHGWEEAEINDALAEEEALHGGKFWMGGSGDEDEDDFDEMMLDKFRQAAGLELFPGDMQQFQIDPMLTESV